MIGHSTIEQKILHHYKFMSDLGFRYEVTEMMDSSLPKPPVGLLFSRDLGFRKIRIVYGPECEEALRCIMIFVMNDTNKRFMLDDFLRKFGRVELNREFIDDNPKDDPSGFIEHTASVFRNICDLELKEILIGNKWLDAPFDWNGYR